MSNSSTFSRQRVKVPAYSTTEVHFNDTKPNYYFVHNMGNSPLYCGTDHMPTEKDYDFMCNPESLKLYAEPDTRTVIYLFNPSGSEVEISLVTFTTEFNPLTLALSNISLDLPTADLGLSTVVSQFNAPLPQGDNKIGSVEVSKLPENDKNILMIVDRLKSIAASIRYLVNPTDDKYITLYDVVQTLQNLKLDNTNVVEAINSLKLEADNSDVVEALQALKLDNSDVVEAINNKDFTANFTGDVTANVDNSDVVDAINGLSFDNKPKQILLDSISDENDYYATPGDGYVYTAIDFFSNDCAEDSGNNYYLRVANSDGTHAEITIKPGEVLNNIPVYASDINITSASRLYTGCRAIFRKEAV